MAKLNYKGLQHVTHTQDPLRGTMNFPMYSDRRQPYSLFQVVETENDIEYHVCYGKDWDTKEITEQKYNLLKGVRGKRVCKKDRDYEPYPFYERITKSRVLAIVRSDNTIEFTLDGYWQGDRKKMSEWIKPSCYMFDGYRFSGNGLTAHANGQDVSMPIFKGLRLDAETLKPHESQNIQVFRRTVDRKKSKPLMERYKTKLDIAHAMLKCLDTDTMMVSARDLYEQYADKTDSNYTFLNSDKAMKIGDDLLDSGAEFEASMMFAMAININGFSDYALKNGGHTRYNICEPKNLVSRIKTSLAKKAYETHKPFYEVEVPFMNTKGSEWGLRVVLNGVDVVR